MPLHKSACSAPLAMEQAHVKVYLLCRYMGWHQTAEILSTQSNNDSKWGSFSVDQHHASALTILPGSLLARLATQCSNDPTLRASRNGLASAYPAYGMVNC